MAGSAPPGVQDLAKRARERFAVQPAIRFHVSSGRFNSVFWSSHCLYGLQTALTGSVRSDDFDYVAGRPQILCRWRHGAYPAFRGLCETVDGE